MGPAVSDYNKGLILLSLIQLSGGRFWLRKAAKVENSIFPNCSDCMILYLSLRLVLIHSYKENACKLQKAVSILQGKLNLIKFVLIVNVVLLDGDKIIATLTYFPLKWK